MEVRLVNEIVDVTATELELDHATDAIDGLRGGSMKLDSLGVPHDTVNPDLADSTQDKLSVEAGSDGLARATLTPPMAELIYRSAGHCAGACLEKQGVEGSDNEASEENAERLSRFMSIKAAFEPVIAQIKQARLNHS